MWFDFLLLFASYSVDGGPPLQNWMRSNASRWAAKKNAASCVAAL
jgi:hypothetical protein